MGLKTTHNSKNSIGKQKSTIKSSDVVSNNKNNKATFNNTSDLKKSNINNKQPTSVNRKVIGAKSNKNDIKTSTNFINKKNMTNRNRLNSSSTSANVSFFKGRKLIARGPILKTNGSNKLPESLVNRMANTKLNPSVVRVNTNFFKSRRLITRGSTLKTNGSNKLPESLVNRVVNTRLNPSVAGINANFFKSRRLITGRFILKTNGSNKLSESLVNRVANRRLNSNVLRINTNFFKGRRLIAKGPILKTNYNKLPKIFNKFADHKILKSTKLDENYQNEIGANTIKSSYNSLVNTKRGIEKTSRSIHTMRQIPKNYNKIKLNIINVPNKIQTAVGKIKIKSKIIKKSTKLILSNVVKGHFTDVLKNIPKGKIVQISINNISKMILGTGKFSKKTTKGAVKLSKNFKNAAINGEDETSDLGSNAVFASIDTLKNSAKLGAKGIKKIYTIRNKVLETSEKTAIKTKSVNRIAEKLKYNFNSFKSSAATKQYIKKYIKKLKNKFKNIIKYIFSNAIKNPISLGIIALVLILFLVITSMLNAIIGFHASYFISISPEQPQWISSMNNLNDDMSTRISQVSDVRTITSNGTEADWKDVIVAYYIKNNYSASLDGSTSVIGTDTASVDPDTWDKIYKELKSYLGKPYVWGGADPKTGFDCSGLVQYVYGKYGISLPRTTYDQVKCGAHIEKSDLQAGDLVFFGTASNVSHVGVYIGNGQYLHAPKTGDVIKISNLLGRSDYYEARRVFQVKESSPNNQNKDKKLYDLIPNKNYADAFYKVQEKTGVDPLLLASIAIVESSLNSNAVSNAGASGLCQIMPDTFKGLGFDLSKIFDPYTNILACSYEILELYAYKSIKSVGDMLTAYNGGIGNFIKYGGPIPGNKENQEYSDKVLNAYKQLSNGQLPSVMSGTQSINANANLIQVYNCFVKFYRQNKKWILRKYTVEEALDNLKFTEDQKEEFYNLKDYNEQFDDKDQFGDYNVNFKFGF